MCSNLYIDFIHYDRILHHFANATDRLLQELNVQGNRITHLRQCDKFLPGSLESLQLAKNGITDLNEICTLSHLSCLQAISVADNPCVQMTGSVVYVNQQHLGDIQC